MKLLPWFQKYYVNAILNLTLILQYVLQDYYKWRSTYVPLPAFDKPTYLETCLRNSTH